MASLELGKVPPQAVDLEEAVLGAVMVEKDALLDIVDILKVESFYKESHQKIFKAILDLSGRLEPIDMLTVTEELRKENLLDEVGGPVFIAQLTSLVGSAAQIDLHAKIIAQKYIQWELIRVSSDIQTRAFDDTVDVDDLLDYSEMELFKVAEGNIKRDSQPINLLVKEALHQIEEAGKREDGLSGVPAGFTERPHDQWMAANRPYYYCRPTRDG